MTSHSNIKSFESQDSFAIPIENTVYISSDVSSSSSPKKNRRRSPISHIKTNSKTSISSSITATSKRSKRVSFKRNFVEIIKVKSLKPTTKVDVTPKKKRKVQTNKCGCVIY